MYGPNEVPGVQPHIAVDPDDAERVEVHVDQFQDTKYRDGAETSVRWDKEVEKKKMIINEKGQHCNVCEYGHDPDVCKCHLEAYHIGQDEAIYKAYALPKGIWIIGGMRALRKKTDGPGKAFKREMHGFSFVCNFLVKSTI